MALHEFMNQYIGVVFELANTMILSGIFFIFVFAISLLLLRVWIRYRAKGLLPYVREGDTTHTVAFFHPYCNAGGGGERVLWTAIRAIQKRYPSVKCVVYTGDSDVTANEILARARQRFNISLPRQVEFVFLSRRGWVEASKYPYFTLLGQSLGSLLLGWEALMAFVPDVFVDSMGYAFTIPLFKFFGGCRVACYVHYPTISTDMLDKVSRRSAAHNNLAFIANSVLLSNMKLWYYRLFAYLYGAVGKRSEVIMVNSTWTYGHIKELWKAAGRTTIVYPPCDVSEFLTISLQQAETASKKNIITVGQFRPEKDHPLMVRSFKLFLDKVEKPEDYRLLLVGSCRNDGDMERVKTLQDLAADLDISDYVEFHLNVDFQELKRLLASSVIGLHAMWNEHFGIGVVECMAAGNVMLAHDSGGPKLDIVTPHNDHPTGFLASSETEYAEAMAKIFSMTSAQRQRIREKARESAGRFSEREFELAFLDRMSTFFGERYGQGDGDR